MVDLFEDYDTLREFSSIPEEDLIDLRIITVFGFSTLFLGFYFVAPGISNAVSHTAQNILQTSQSENFFEIGAEKFTKLYREIDYRPAKRQLKKVLKTRIEDNIIDTSLKNVVEISLPVINLTPLFTKNKIKIVETTIAGNGNPSFLVQKLQGLSTAENSLLLRGGFAGYALGKLAEKLGKKAVDWVDHKTDQGELKNNGWSTSKKKNDAFALILQYFQNNPVLMALAAAWVYLNRKKAEEEARKRFPEPIVNIILGKKHTFKSVFFTIISPRKPYLYLTIGVLIILFNRRQFYKLFRREMTPSEVISEITKSFLKTNSELFNKFYDLTLNFTGNTVKNEDRSFENSQKAAKEKTDLLERNISELKAEKFQLSQDLKQKNEAFTMCQNTYNLLNGQSKDFVEKFSRDEAYKILEFEVKSRITESDSQYLLTGPELIQKEVNYKKRFEELFHETKQKNLKLLEEKITPTIFEEKKN
jgi:hypothetical protein